jgi:hypothetical protein
VTKRALFWVRATDVLSLITGTSHPTYTRADNNKGTLESWLLAVQEALPSPWGLFGADPLPRAKLTS